MIGAGRAYVYYPRLDRATTLRIPAMIEEGNEIAVEAESHGVMVDGKPYRNQHHNVLREYGDYPDTLVLSELLSGRALADDSVSRATLRNGTGYYNDCNFLFELDRRGKVLEFQEYWGRLHAFETLFEERTVLDP